MIMKSVLPGMIFWEKIGIEREGGFAYIKNDLNYNIRQDLSSSNEAIFLEIYLPHSKPILIRIFYRPPNDSDLLVTFQDIIGNAREFNNQEFYILGDMNINLGKNIKNKTSIINEYNGFCKTNDMLQIITSYTHVTKTSYSLIDHILTNSQDRISQSGVIGTTFSDHFSIFCTRKITRNKPNKHKTIKIRSYKIMIKMPIWRN